MSHVSFVPDDGLKNTFLRVHSSVLQRRNKVFDRNLKVPRKPFNSMHLISWLLAVICKSSGLLLGTFSIGWNSVKSIGIFQRKTYCKQECIPVGCVPPAAVAVHRGVCLSACWDTHPPWCWPGDPPGCGPGVPPRCGPGDPPGQTPQLPPWVWALRPPGNLQGMLGYHLQCMLGYHPLWTEWQTGAKILPCPKLHLRAVIMFYWYTTTVASISKMNDHTENDDE